MTKRDHKRYLKVFEHPNLQLMDVDRRVAAKAAVIREFYDTRAFDASGVPIIGSGSVMSLADSIHLATAIHFNVDEFQTVDGSGKHKRRLDLLKLNGDVAGSRLKITLPYYIEPPKPLEGPLDGPKPGPQVGLFDSMGEASATEKTGAEPDEK